MSYACGRARDSRVSRDAHDVGRSTFELHTHGAYVGRDGNAARAAEYCRLLPFTCARHRLRGSALPILIPVDVQRTADRRMIGRFKITFAGRTLCRQHASCIRVAKILAQVGVAMSAVECACAKWLMAGLEQSEQEHYRNGFVVRRAIREGSIAAPSHRTA